MTRFRATSGRELETYPVVRALVRLGMDRSLRWAAFCFVTLVFWWAISNGRPDLRDPTTVGGDPWNYLAGTERAVAGHGLYALTTGDRPVPADAPPLFSVPLLSPPPVIVPWLPLLLLPAALAMVAWWLACFVVSTGVTIAAIARAPAWGLLLILLLAYSIAITAWSGNVNGMLIGVVSLIWWTRARRGWRWQGTAGALVGLAAAIKLTPVFLVAWLIGQRQWRSVVAAGVALVAATAVAIVVAGPDAFNRYLSIASSTGAAGNTPLSLPGLLDRVGFTGTWTRYTPPVAGFVLAAGALALRDRPGISFAIAIVAVVVGSPVVRFESLALFLPAVIPAARRGGKPLPGDRRLAIGGSVALAAVGLVALQAPSPSALVIDNRADESRVVRVATGAPGSFGFLLAPGESGVGWSVDAGRVNATLEVFDASCRRLTSLELPATGGLLLMDASGARVVDQTRVTGRPVPFTSSCARETYRQRP